MKFVNLETTLPLNKLENNLRKADYYSKDEKFGEWDLADYNKNQQGIHLSYDEKSKKICAYYEDGIEHKDFITPITSIFSGKIVEKNNLRYIKGRVNMSPIFNIIALLVFVGLAGAYAFLKNPNIAILFLIFIVYFVYAKYQYRDCMQKIIYFLGECTYTEKKKKKINPNRKKGKWSGKKM